MKEVQLKLKMKSTAALAKQVEKEKELEDKPLDTVLRTEETHDRQRKDDDNN